MSHAYSSYLNCCNTRIMTWLGQPSTHVTFAHVDKSKIFILQIEMNGSIVETHCTSNNCTYYGHDYEHWGFWDMTNWPPSTFSWNFDYVHASLASIHTYLHHVMHVSFQIKWLCLIIYLNSVYIVAQSLMMDDKAPVQYVSYNSKNLLKNSN